MKVDIVITRTKIMIMLIIKLM